MRKLVRQKKGYKAVYKRVRYYLEFPAKFPLEGLIGVELDLKREGDTIIIKPKNRGD